MAAERFCQGCGIELPAPKKMNYRQKWCSNKCRKHQYGDPCVDCGARTTFGADRARVPDPRCASCATAKRNDEYSGYRHLVEGMWAEGLTARQIADALGWEMKAKANTYISLFRGRGWNLPHRRTPEQVHRMAGKSGLEIARAVYRDQRKAAA